MKDFISKVTFGFFMAQFLPGAIVVFSVTCLCLWSDVSCQTLSVREFLLKSGECWFNSTFGTIAFVFIAISTGMVIHGLNWAVLAWLEHKANEKNLETIRGHLGWYKLCFALQLIIAPLAMMLEIVWLLTASKITYLMMDENVSKLPADKMEQFTFLQDFYLNFGQFYAHMAYAFLVGTVCGAISLFQDFSLRRIGLFIGLYLLTSIFYLLGQIQLGSLFEAENALCENKKSEEL